MADISVARRTKRAKKPHGGQPERGADAGAARPVKVRVYGPQFAVVMAAAQRIGLLQDKGGRIGGRVSPALIQTAKTRSGIDSDTDLIAFALANIALDDRFAEAFEASRGTVDPDLKLGF